MSRPLWHGALGLLNQALGVTAAHFIPHIMWETSQCPDTNKVWQLQHPWRTEHSWAVKEDHFTLLECTCDSLNVRFIKPWLHALTLAVGAVCLITEGTLTITYVACVTHVEWKTASKVQHVVWNVSPPSHCNNSRLNDHKFEKTSKHYIVSSIRGVRIKLEIINIVLYFLSNSGVIVRTVPLF